MQKLYINQNVIFHDDLELPQYYIKPRPLLNMLIGFSKKQKDAWVSRYLEKNETFEGFVIRLPLNNQNSWYYCGMQGQRWMVGSWYDVQVRKREMIRYINSIIKSAPKSPPIVLMGNTSDSFLSMKDRVYLLSLFPNYYKHVIVWEEELEKMNQFGYERPTLDEGFDDFTYYVS